MNSNEVETLVSFICLDDTITRDGTRINVFPIHISGGDNRRSSVASTVLDTYRTCRQPSSSLPPRHVYVLCMNQGLVTLCKPMDDVVHGCLYTVIPRPKLSSSSNPGVMMTPVPLVISCVGIPDAFVRLPSVVMLPPSPTASSTSVFLQNILAAMPGTLWSPKDLDQYVTISVTLPHGVRCIVQGLTTAMPVYFDCCRTEGLIANGELPCTGCIVRLAVRSPFIEAEIRCHVHSRFGESGGADVHVWRRLDEVSFTNSKYVVDHHHSNKRNRE
eukprot:PhF_6_TR39799/c0_g1_i1/m.59188